jgi:hypothetical protein
MYVAFGFDSLISRTSLWVTRSPPKRRVQKILADIEHAPADIGGMPFQKAFDVVAVKRRAAIAAEAAADRLDPLQIAEIDQSDRWIGRLTGLIGKTPFCNPAAGRAPVDAHRDRLRTFDYVNSHQGLGHLPSTTTAGRAKMFRIGA